MNQYGNLELFLNTREAADLWLAMHQSIREQKARDANTNLTDGIDPLTQEERSLYDALTSRFTEGLQR